MRRSRRSGRSGSGRWHASTPRRRSSSCRESSSSPTRRDDGAAGGSEDPAVAAVLPRLRVHRACAGTDGPLRAPPARRGAAAERGRGRLRRAVRREDAPHDALGRTDPERILEQAERDYDVVRAEMVRIATELWPTWFPDTEPPADEQRLVRGVLDAIAADHLPSEELLDFCRKSSSGRGVRRERDLIGLADEPLDIRWTRPSCVPSAARCSIPPGRSNQREGLLRDHPGPRGLAGGAQGVVPARGQRADARLLTIHEAVPGHYLQGVYDNRDRRCCGRSSAAACSTRAGPCT